MKTYYAKRSDSVGGQTVYVCEEGGVPRELAIGPSLGIAHHSPDGFNWGYPGSGAAQLALAILLDSLGRKIAVAFYQTFKFKIVADWGDSWKITDDEIDRFVGEEARKAREGLPKRAERVES